MGYIEQEAAEAIAKAQHKREQIELLNWFMQLCESGATMGMIRKIVHNKLVELTGEGEKA